MAIFTNRTIDSLHLHPWSGKRWEKDPELSHELYNLGHLYEAAYAHFLLPGNVPCWMYIKECKPG